LVVQAWLLRLLASLIVVVAIAGGAWLLRFGHPGFIILALMLARGAWPRGTACTRRPRHHQIAGDMACRVTYAHRLGSGRRSHWKSCR
jgi:hypothetical protein